MKATTLILIYLFVFQPSFGQDAIVYSSWYYNGQPYNLNIGQSVTFKTGSAGPSIDIKNPQAGVKVRRFSRLYSCSFGNMGVTYPETYYYTEIDQPFVGESDNYNDTLIVVSCVERYLPQPEIFIPLDRSNVNPDIPHKSLDLVPGHRMLMLRKANFWDNSEERCETHGPFEEITFNICSTRVMQLTYQDMSQNTSLWHEPNGRIKVRTLPGFSYDADLGWFYDDPRNEWIDNWWGIYYSNYAMWDWNKTNLDSIAIIIATADPSNPEDLLGRAVIKKSWEGRMLIKCRHFGWLVLENVDITATSETSVDVANNYVYIGWDGNRIEGHYGPNNDKKGSQYNPFESISQVENQVPQNYDVGILGDGWIKAPNDLTVPMNYIAAAPDLDETYSYVFNWDDLPSILYYRSRQTGNWNDVETWETSPVSTFSSGIVSPANAMPQSENTKAVLIQNGHTVTVTKSVTSKKATVNNGGKLLVNPNVNFKLID